MAAKMEVIGSKTFRRLVRGRTKFACDRFWDGSLRRRTGAQAWAAEFAQSSFYLLGLTQTMS
jgi:hypothetical protein